MWNQNFEKHDLSNSNFWLHHLEQQIGNLNKTKKSLYEFKNFEAFFSDRLTDSDNKANLLRSYLKIAEQGEQAQFALMSNQQINIEEKYLDWKAIDFMHRKRQLRALKDHSEIQIFGQLNAFFE